MSAKPATGTKSQGIAPLEPLPTERGVARSKAPVAVLTEGKHFSRCPAAAAFDRNLTDGEVRALAAAGAFTDKDCICRASQSTIARRLGISRQVVNRWFAALVAKGYLRLERTTKRANGSRGPNVYRLIYPPLAQGEPERLTDAQGHRTSGDDEPCTSDVPGSITLCQLVN